MYKLNRSAVYNPAPVLQKKDLTWNFLSAVSPARSNMAVRMLVALLQTCVQRRGMSRSRSTP